MEHSSAWLIQVGFFWNSAPGSEFILCGLNFEPRPTGFDLIPALGFG